LKGNEVLILMLAFQATPQDHMQLIAAAADAGIKWIIPTEFGSDNGNKPFADMVPINAMKSIPRDHVEELAKTHPGLSWIGVVTSSWFDYVCISPPTGSHLQALINDQTLKGGFFGIDTKNKTATLYDDGKARFSTTLLSTVGLAVARLLSLPVESSSGASLSTYANKFIYLSSFHTTQQEILDAVQKATKTTESDWTITKLCAQSYVDQGNEKMARGDFSGMVDLLYAVMFKEGLGADYESVKGTSNEVLGLPKEDMVEVVRRILGA
jgi:hypothetical protein